MIKIDSQKMYKALNVVAPVVLQKTILPITSCVRVTSKNNVISVTATSMDSFIVHHFNHEGDDFDIMLPFKEFRGVCQFATGFVTIKESPSSVTAVAGKTNYKLGTPVDVDHFPTLPKVDENNKFDVDSDFFWAMSQASRTVSKDTMTAVDNILIHLKDNEINIVSYCFKQAYCHALPVDFNGEIKALVHPSFADLSKHITDSTVYISEKSICVKGRDTDVYSSLSEGEFVPYGTLLGRFKEPNCELSVSDLKSALNQVSVVRTHNIPWALFHLSRDNMKISYTDHDVNVSAEPELPISNSSAVKEIAFNIDHVNTALNQLPPESEKLKIYFIDETNLAFFTPDTEDKIKILIQPIKITEK